MSKLASGSRDGDRELSPGASLAIHWPAGGTLLLAAVVLAVLAGGAEAVARCPCLDPYLPVGSYGTESRYFDFQFDRFRQFVDAHGAPDCVFIGSSVVFRGIDPEAFEASYLERTGDRLRCFNFGVRGMDPQSEAILARVLHEDFAPGLLIVGLEVPNLASGQAESLRARFPSSSWARYRLGDFSLEGWLTDQSAAFRAYLVYRNWTRAEFSADEIREFDVDIAQGILPTGFGGYLRTSPRIGRAPGEDDPQAEFFELLREFTLDPGQTQAVEDLAVLGRQTPILLFEPPVHRTFLAFYGGGRADYLRGLEFLQSTAADAGLLFFSTTPLNLVPDDGWGNRNHLNEQGAELFSHWLGLQVGQAVLEGSLPDPLNPGAIRGETS